MKMIRVTCSSFPSPANLLKWVVVVMGIALGHECVAQGWELTIGGNSYDEGNAIAAAVDGGFILVGFSESFGDDGDLDILVTRTDIDGKVLWNRFYDEGFQEHGFDVLSEEDGTFLVVGDMNTDENPMFNVLLMKLTKEGKPLWSRTYDAPAREVGKAITKASDGGYLIAGLTEDTHNGEQDILLLKVDADGNFQWRKTLGTDKDDAAEAIIALEDGFVVAGNSDNPERIDSDIVLYKTDKTGQQVWMQRDSISTEEADGVYGLTATRDGNIVIGGLVGFNSDAYIAKLDAGNGEVIWESQIGGPMGDKINDIFELPDGNLIAVGQSEKSESNLDALLVKLDADGNELWRSLLGEEDITEYGVQIVPTLDGKLTFVGWKSKILNDVLSDMYLVKTDDQGNTITNYVTGRVYRDMDEGCNGYDLTRDVPLNDWLVRVSSKDKGSVYYGTTDEEGRYAVLVDTGSYNVNILPVNPYWSNCVEAGYEITLTEFYDTTTLNFPVTQEITCPYLEVDISTPFLAACSDIVYAVDYCNTGTAAAQDAYVEVTLDESLEFISADLPVTAQDGNLYTFELGDIASTECGSFGINTRLACDGIAQGQAGLVSAHIFPDTLCIDPDPRWDGSSLLVSGNCILDRPDAPIEFRIRNVGKGDMIEPRPAIVTQDDIVWLRGADNPIQLPAGAETTIEIDDYEYGATYRLIVEQSAFHPGRSFPTAFVEGCVEEGDEFSTGFATMFPENDLDPNISIDVQEVTGSDKSVELRGYPKGYGDSLLVAENTDLTYTIFFRNIGTDTINRVVIRDTLSTTNLDITTVVPGASNFPYDFEVYDNGILKITFSGIKLLPEGSVGDAASYGFVKFSVSQKPDNPVGTLIENRAAVYFDYLKPVVTNSTRNYVGDFPSYITVTGIDQVFWPGVKINVYPNPFIEAVVFDIEGYDFNDVILSIFDTAGRLLHSSRHTGNEIMYYRSQLPSGLYFFKLETEGKLISSGKLSVR